MTPFQSFLVAFGISLVIHFSGYYLWWYKAPLDEEKMGLMKWLSDWPNTKEKEPKVRFLRRVDALSWAPFIWWVTDLIVKGYLGQL